MKNSRSIPYQYLLIAMLPVLMLTACGGGGSSPVVAFGAFLLGHTDMAIYDGAWEDWALHPDALVEKSS